jgi:hypothetical protein
MFRSGWTAQQASNGLAIDGGCSPLNPIKRSETVVIADIRIGAVR